MEKEEREEEEEEGVMENEGAELERVEECLECKKYAKKRLQTVKISGGGYVLKRG